MPAMNTHSASRTPPSATAHVYGDDVDTDRIIPGKYTKTLDLSQLAAHVLEDLDPGFRERVRPGDVIVAGDNFGCGSSREQAPLAIQAAGVSAVVARSFARIFYRNAINVGLPILEVPGHAIAPGARLAVDVAAGVVRDETAGASYHAAALPPIMLAILDAGGLVPYLREHGDFVEVGRQAGEANAEGGRGVVGEGGGLSSAERAITAAASPPEGPGAPADLEGEADV